MNGYLVKNNGKFFRHNTPHLVPLSVCKSVYLIVCCNVDTCFFVAIGDKWLISLVAVGLYYCLSVHLSVYQSVFHVSVSLCKTD